MAAIVDWEMCTVGDPLLDLGWLLATGRAPAAAGAGIAGIGLASRRARRASTPKRSTRDLSRIGWYRVLACFKLGIVLEGTNARADAGLAPREIGDLLHASAVALFTQALDLVTEG